MYKQRFFLLAFLLINALPLFSSETANLEPEAIFPPTKNVDFSPDETQLLTTDSTWTKSGGWGRVILWDRISEQVIKIFTSNDVVVSDAEFSPDGKWVLGATLNAGSYVYDIESESKVCGFGFNTLTFSHDGQKLLSGTISYMEKNIGIYDIKAKTYQLFIKHEQFVSAIAFSPDSTMFCSGDWGGALIVWNVNSGDAIYALNAHAGYVNSLAYSPDGTKILSGGADGAARIWDAKTGAMQQEILSHEDSITSVDYSPDGSMILTGSLDMTARLWEAESGRLLYAFHHAGKVNSVCFSPLGHYLATAGEDQTNIWNMSEVKKLTSIHIWNIF
ncbi:MAG: WD40 repeat domain-containing protein [Candidatus Omnitrophota bacterium]